MPGRFIEVLIVEDNPADARLVDLLLNEAAPSQFSMTHVGRLDNAVGCLSSSRRSFDVVLLDLSLPDSEGLAGLTEMIAASPLTPVIVLSGYDSEERAIQAVQSGAQDYLIKGQGDGHLLARAIRYAIERKQAEERLRYLSTHDTLTQLPNRTLFSDRLGQSMAKSRRDGGVVAVLYVDLDRFKIINDTLGHAAGDLMLTTVSKRLTTCVREGDTVARIGGDEFVIVLTDLAHTQDIARIAKAVLDAFSNPFSLAGRELFTTASIGIALFPEDGDNPETLLENADTAMYRAKERGRNNYQYYSAVMHTAALIRLEMETGLRGAIGRNELTLHYQLLADLSSLQISGIEALLRWQRNGEAYFPPAEFIPLAEETGLVVPIGEWVLQTACAQNRAWRDLGLPLVRIAVNLSPIQIQQKNFVQMVQGALDAHGLPADSLELEITEGAMMQDVERAIPMLQHLHEMGIRIAVDDFGTGYSSLNYLRRFAIDTLKIDRSFVRDITTDADDAAIVRAIVTLAHSLDLTVVAEGVETLEQLHYLQALGCNKIQGYLFSRPIAADEMTALLRGGWQDRITHSLNALLTTSAHGVAVPAGRNPQKAMTALYPPPPGR